ncbi:patatin-like phospholipase family protein [Streptomyces sp. NPDC002676]
MSPSADNPRDSDTPRASRFTSAGRVQRAMRAAEHAWAADSPTGGTGLQARRCGDVLRPANPPPADLPVAMCLSGGGFRATLAALGFVRMLADTGMLTGLRYASSVSGGSIANGVLATAWPELQKRGLTTTAFDELVLKPVVHKVSSKSLKTSLILGLWQTLGPMTRTELLARRLDEWFFDGTELEQLDPQVRWIFNAANLTTGVRFGFERDVYGDYVTGLAPTAGRGLTLSRAVAASAAVPGAFPPLVLDRTPFPCAAYDPALLDGGTYDNTATEALDSEYYRPDFLFILNAGGLLHPGPYGRVPIVRDLARANSLLYRQSTALRTRVIDERFHAGLKPGQADAPGTRHGILVELATDFSDVGKPGLNTWRQRFEERTDWGGRHLASVPTVFDRFDLGLCQALVYRGWWLAGAALSAFHPERMPNIDSLEPPQL